MTPPIVRIVVNPGHGPNNITLNEYDTGATSQYGEEAAIVAKIANDLVAMCAGTTPKIVVVPTPPCTPDCPNHHPRSYVNPLHVFGHLEYTIDWVNKNTTVGDFLISLHMNEGGPEARGVEVYYANGVFKRRRKQAQAAAVALSTVLGIPTRGCFPSEMSQHSRLGILDRTKIPALLFELGFVSNADDVHAVTTRGVEAVLEAIKAIQETR